MLVPFFLRALFVLPAILLVAGAYAAPRAARSTSAASRSAPPADGLRVEDAIALTGYSELTWSPDGRRLAFVASTPDTAENANNLDLWIVDAAGGRARRLTRHAQSRREPDVLTERRHARVRRDALGGR